MQSIKKSSIVFYICISFIIGIAINSIINTIVIETLFILGITLISVFWRQWQFVLIGFCLIAISTGFFRANYNDLTWNIPKKIQPIANSANNTIQQILPYPQSALLSALLLGQKSELPKKILNNFSCTGTRHIIALSGYHTAVVVMVLMSILLYLGFWRSQAFYLTIISVVVFVLITGASPSTIRAGIMSSSILIAQKIGRLQKTRNIIALTSAIMLLKEPSLLMHNIAFELSFLAVIGIVYLYPILKSRLRFIPEIILISLSAQIAVAPLILYYFQQASLISPLANLITLPILPFVIITGFPILLISVFSIKIGIFFTWPIWFLLSYIIEINNLLSRIPFACIKF